jgi:hypothetical protein
MANYDAPSAELMKHLGLLVTRWAMVEAHVSELFSKLTEGNRGAMYVVTANVSQSTLTGWIRTLLDCYQLPPEDAKELRDRLNDVDELRIERNIFVHGLWAWKDGSSATVQTVRLDRSTVVQELLVTPADLDEISDRIRELSLQLGVLVRGIRAA